MIKASATITLSFMVDVMAVYRYYKLQASTASAPTVPTSATPSGWTDAEPTYTEGSTNTLYFVDKTVFTNNTFLYSAVSKSTSYEAAKAAYNKAVAASDSAEAAMDAVANKAPFIAGTQTAATGSWTGVAPFASLQDGQKITYWLPYSGSGNATLNLTLSDGSKTGAVNCYYSGSTRLNTHFAAGNAIELTYRKDVSISGGSTKYTGWWANANHTTTNSTQEQYNVAIKAFAAITAGTLIAGDSAGYAPLSSARAFDINYPILYAGSNMSAGATGTNNYLVCNIAVAKTQSMTLTPYTNVYVKGRLQGNMFTPASSAPLTQTLPSAEDGYVYLRLGYAYSSTNFKLDRDHTAYKWYEGAVRSFSEIATMAATAIDPDHIISTINLSSDGVQIQGKFIRLNGVVYIAKNTWVEPTIEDFLRVKEYVYNQGNLSPDQLIVYDINCDGVVDFTDYLWIKRAAYGYYPIGPNAPAQYQRRLVDVVVTIDSSKPEEAIVLSGTTPFGSSFRNVIGLALSKLNSLATDHFECQGDASVGENLDVGGALSVTGDLNVDGDVVFTGRSSALNPTSLAAGASLLLSPDVNCPGLAKGQVWICTIQAADDAYSACLMFFVGGMNSSGNNSIKWVVQDLGKWTRKSSSALRMRLDNADSVSNVVVKYNRIV